MKRTASVDAKALERDTFWKLLDGDVELVAKTMLGRFGDHKLNIGTKVLLKDPLHIGDRDKSWYLHSHTEYATSKMPSAIV